MSLKTAFLSALSSKYDGSQLKPGWIYQEVGLLGSAAVAWVGPCDVSLDHMVDLQDLKNQSAIRADRMLHLVGEFFHLDVTGGLFLQRLVAEALASHVAQTRQVVLERDGDDLYWGSKKLNVSIVSSSLHSCLLHFGINVTNAGTPVATCALEDFNLPPVEVAGYLLKLLEKEVTGVFEALYKIRRV